MGIVSATTCAVSGQLATDACRNDSMGYGTVTDYWYEPTVPTVYCQMHQSMTVCADTGMLATEYCPNTTVKGVVVIPNGHPLATMPTTPNMALSLLNIWERPATTTTVRCTRTDIPAAIPLMMAATAMTVIWFPDAQQLLQTAYDFMSQLDASSTHYQNIQTAASNLQGF